MATRKARRNPRTMRSYIARIDYGEGGTGTVEAANLASAWKKAVAWARDGDWPKDGEVRVSVEGADGSHVADVRVKKSKLYR